MVLATSLKLVASHTAYPDGAPPGFSGGFKEDSCQACHFLRDLNDPSGRLVINGVPPQYESGKQYTITITLTRADMKLAGFQLAARFKDSGAQAGTLAPSSADASRVTIADDGKIQYANQNKVGSALAESGVAKWSVDWTAPSNGGAIVFNVAANAADGGGSTDGDFVYTAMVESISGPAADAARFDVPPRSRRVRQR